MSSLQTFLWTHPEYQECPDSRLMLCYIFRYRTIYSIERLLKTRLLGMGVGWALKRVHLIMRTQYGISANHDLWISSEKTWSWMCRVEFVFSLNEHTGAAMNQADYKTGSNRRSIDCEKTNPISHERRIISKVAEWIMMALIQVRSSPLQRFKEFLLSWWRRYQ